MDKGNTPKSQKRRGPEPTGKGEPVLVRIQPPLLSKIDAWIARQDDKPTRPGAVRRLVEKGLSAKPARTSKAIPVSKLNALNDK